MKTKALLAACLLAGGTLACFGSAPPQRSYYMLQGVALQSPTAILPGMVRVRDLDAAAVYEKFQIVVRKSPYEVQYSEDHVWAVKPNRMVSDVIARALAESGAFQQVVREIAELRPDYILGGDMHAIEIYDSDDEWYAHLSVTLTLSKFSTGDRLLTFVFDERKPVPNQTFSQAARGLSELLGFAVDAFVHSLAEKTGAVPTASPAPVHEHGGITPAPEPGKVIYLDERRRPAPERPPGQ